MGIRSYKAKLIVIAVLFTLAAQAVFIWIGYAGANEIGQDVQVSTEEHLFQYSISNVTGYLNDANSLMTRLGSTDFTVYSRAYLNLQPPAEAAAKIADLNVRLNALEISPKLVDKIFMLGDNVNQRSFVKSTDSAELSEEPIPWIDDLRDSGLLDTFLKVYGLPVYFAKGQLTAKLDAMEGRLPPDQMLRLRHFLQQVEGHLVINNGIDDTKVMSFIVLSPEFLQDTLSGGGESGLSLFLDRENRIVWTNMPEGPLKASIVRLAAESREPASACDSDVPNKLGKRIKACMLQPYGFKLITAADTGGASGPANLLLVRYLSLSFAAIVITFVVAYVFSGMIFQPYRTLSNLIRAQAYASEIRNIPLSLIQRRLASISLRQKIATLLLLSVIVPAVSAGFLYAWLLGTYSVDQVNKALTRTSAEMGKVVKLRKEAYENLINKLSVDDRLQRYLFLSVPLMDSYPVSSPDMFVSLYPELSDVSYFALYNSSGIARYSSIFLNNLDLFSQKIDPIPALQDDGAQPIIWVTGKRDVYGRPAVSLIKKSLYPVYAASPDMQQLGYLELVLKDNAFQPVDPDHKLDFVILDRSGGVIYRSNSNAEYVDTAVQLRERQQGAAAAPVAMRKTAGQEQAVAPQPIGRTGWTMYVFYPFDEILSASRQIFYRDMFIVLLAIMIAYAISWMCSLFLERPVKRLQSMMEEIGQGHLERRFGYEARDEIGSLVISINKMIAQIRFLMDENVKNRVREQQLIALKTKAELSMLQQQINPHFLYNTLEAINMRSKRYGAEEICTMVGSLAKIFRFSISSGSEIVTVEAEIEHIRNYMTIQQLRFAGNFSVEWQLEPGALPRNMLKFILQPVVENALNHGIMEYSSGGAVRIKAAVEGGRLLLEVGDNGIGIEPKRLEQLRQSLAADSGEPGEIKTGRGGGVGLKNVYNRLKIHYGDRASMTIDSRMMAGTVVRIVLTEPA
ncbi:sensor histidine kinase [Paenibacillus humicola]|uniref:sensor histidine kinase n=1 Tax=Paenibacillus humicola TaxID=3110540 RepID=UPI00237BC93E|nr:sensor histidine kinase [Paenibacillus humicola]